MNFLTIIAFCRKPRQRRICKHKVDVYRFFLPTVVRMTGEGDFRIKQWRMLPLKCFYILIFSILFSPNIVQRKCRELFLYTKLIFVIQKNSSRHYKSLIISIYFLFIILRTNIYNIAYLICNTSYHESLYYEWDMRADLK